VTPWGRLRRPIRTRVVQDLENHSRKRVVTKNHDYLHRPAAQREAAGLRARPEDARALRGRITLLIR
jgi:hypothetical protein